MGSLVVVSYVASAAHMVEVMQTNQAGAWLFILFSGVVVLGLWVCRKPKPKPLTRPPGRKKP